MITVVDFRACQRWHIFGFQFHQRIWMKISLIVSNFRFGLEYSWTTTIFVLNLAFVDLLYSAICLPLRALQFFCKGWFWGETVCKMIAIFDYITAGTEFLSVAMVALSKCINLIKPKLGERLFSDVAGKVCIGFIWIIAWIYNIIMYKFKVCRCHIQTYK